MIGKKYLKQKKSLLGAMKYLPYSIYKLIENIPNPWEEIKYVNVVYHKEGCLNLIKNTPFSIEQIYLAQWSVIW